MTHIICLSWGKNVYSNYAYPFHNWPTWKSLHLVRASTEEASLLLTLGPVVIVACLLDCLLAWLVGWLNEQVYRWHLHINPPCARRNHHCFHVLKQNEKVKSMTICYIAGTWWVPQNVWPFSISILGRCHKHPYPIAWVQQASRIAS